MRPTDLLTLAVQSVKKWTELDYMEYSSDALAQAAYVSSDGDTGNTDKETTPDNWVANYNHACGPFTKVGNAYITSITFYLKNTSGGTSSLVFGIYGDTGSTLPGTLLVSGTGSVANNFDDWKTITVSSTLITNGTVFWICVNSSTDLTTYYDTLAGSKDPYKADTYDGTLPASFGTPVSIPVDRGYSAYITSDSLQSYSESTIKTQGTYSLKGVAAATDSLNDTLTRTISSSIDLSDQDLIKMDIRASRTGENIQVIFHNDRAYGADVTSGQTYTESGYDEHIPTEGGPSSYMYDDDLDSYWRKIGVSGAWATIQFSSAKSITKYRLYSPASGYFLVAWTLSGSNNGSDWESLDVVSGETEFESGWRDYYIDSPASYIYYKFSDITMSGVQNIVFYEIEMMEDGPTTITHTIDIDTADEFQTESIDISGVANEDKDAIDQIQIKIINADA